MTAGVVWFRRDLRLEDNPAWAAATSAHDEVVAVFVIEAVLMKAAGAIRRDQLLAHLHALNSTSSMSVIWSTSMVDLQGELLR